MWRAFCRMNLRVAVCSEVKPLKRRSRSESECEKRVKLHVADPKPR